MAIQPIDVVLFLVSFAACFYCFVLSRRLRALHDTKEGIGATIMALTKSISTVSNTAQSTKEHTAEMIVRLAAQLQEAEAACARMEALISELQETQKSATLRTQSAQADISELIEDLQSRSEQRVNDLTNLMREQIIEAQTELSGTMKRLLDQSKEQIVEMTTVSNNLETLLEQAKTMGRDLDKAGLGEPRPVFKAV